MTSRFWACDFQILKGGSHDFLIQKVNASTETVLSNIYHKAATSLKSLPMSGLTSRNPGHLFSGNATELNISVIILQLINNKNQLPFCVHYMYSF